MASAGWLASERLPGWKATSFRCMKSFGSSKNARTSKATSMGRSEQPEYGRLSWSTYSIWDWNFRNTTSIPTALCDSDDRERTLADLCARLRGGIAGYPRCLLGAVQAAPGAADDQPTPSADRRTRKSQGSLTDFAQGEGCRYP